MSDPLPGFGPTDAPAPARPTGRLVRVQPDIVGIDGGFVYEVPHAWNADGRDSLIDVGGLVRIDFGGRRLRGWILDVDVSDPADRAIARLKKWSSVGPNQEIIDLGRWAAWRWSGSLVHLLRAATPTRMVRERRTPVPPRSPEPPVGFERAFAGGVSLLRTLPSDDHRALVHAATQLGQVLVMAPSLRAQSSLLDGLRALGVRAHPYPESWDLGARGHHLVGTRSAAFATMPSLAAIVVIDEHDSAFKEERTPSWNARDVAVERGRRANIPVVLTSPTPTLEALELADRVLAPSRTTERAAWPHVAVVDLRTTERPGLLTEHVVEPVRSATTAVCVLNRKGRARMLVCRRCDTLATCERCSGSVIETDEGTLRCTRDDTIRPMVCLECSNTSFKLLRPGITSLERDLRVLAGREVIEVSADTTERLPTTGLFLGTEAVLHRVEAADVVVFLDFDQELSRPRARAGEEAFAMLGRAARIVGPRAGAGRVIVQTRRPNDIILEAATQGDPRRVAEQQRSVRSVFGQPPYGAWAIISGAGGSAMVSALDTHADLQVAKRDDRWRVAAADHNRLLNAIAAVPRPDERVRIVVDPLDA